MTKLRAQLRALGDDRSGSVALMFGMILLVLFGSCALGFDYARALAVRSKLQSAVDAAALAANPFGTATPAQITSTVAKTFDYNVPNAFGAVAIKATSTPITNGVRVEATADVPTTFGQVLGITVIPVKVKAEAVAGGANVEFALALDNTFSMSGSKIAALKSAANDLLDQVFDNSTPGTLKAGIVPFANYVNVGKGYRSAKWLSVSNDYSETVKQCYPDQKYKNCTIQSGTCYNDGVPYTCTWSECEPDGPPTTVCGDVTTTYTWNGCVGSREPTDVQAAASSASPVPGIMNVTCPTPLTRLTASKSDLQNQISSMTVVGETYVPAGLLWGWRLLSNDTPFADGAAPNSTPRTRKILVLMTDGENTRSQLGKTHDGTTASSANTTMSQVCTNIKLQNIEIYTIAFEVADVQIKTLLQQCATTSSNFYDAANATLLNKAFADIAGSLQKLALSK
jgi:Flp pilus assembly protein TadG